MKYLENGKEPGPKFFKFRETMDLTDKIKISDDSLKNIYKNYFEIFKITMEFVISESADNPIFPLITNVINVLFSIKLSIINCICGTCCSLY